MTADANKYSHPFIAAFGNPLLDMCAVIDDLEILRNYGLQADGQKEISKEELKIIDEISKRFSLQFSAGGAAQNTLRIFQWLIKKPFHSVFFGGIGKDERGNILEKLVKESGVLTRYSYYADYPTGSCLALINGENRSLIAYLGAANVFESSSLDDRVNIDLLKKVSVIYVEGFFISHSFQSFLKVAELAKQNNTVLISNLSAVYICESYPHEVIELVKHSSIIFGNGEEFKALGKLIGVNSKNLSDVAVKVKEKFDSCVNHNTLKQHGPSGVLKEGKLIVITQGKDKVYCIYGSTNSVLQTDVPVIDNSLVKDTTGAGDSFVAGFLAGIYHGCDIHSCVNFGCWAAKEIIQHVGCTVPSYPPDGATIFIQK